MDSNACRTAVLLLLLVDGAQAWQQVGWGTGVPKPVWGALTTRIPTCSHRHTSPHHRRDAQCQARRRRDQAHLQMVAAPDRLELVRQMKEEQDNADNAFAAEASSRPFPMTLIVGQDSIKTALLLAAVNPAMGGVVIGGSRGTAKSVLARSLARIMPPIERVKGSVYNLDPAEPKRLDSLTEQALKASGKSLTDMETEIIPCPFVQVPLGVLEDRLLGSVDVEASVGQGKTVFEPGLLAAAHRGVLYIDDINLLDQELAQMVLSAVTDGWVTIEREGVSMRHPCKPLLVATYNPEEQELRDTLMDRIAVSLSADAVALTLDQRVEAIRGVRNFAEVTREALTEIEDEEDNVRTRIIFARESLKDTQLKEEQMLYLCEEAARAGCQGHRAEIFASEVARASAALNDRRVSSDDLRLAVTLAIAPRGTFINSPMEEDMMQQQRPPPPPPPPQGKQDDQDPEMDGKSDDKEGEENEDEPDEPPEPPEEDPEDQQDSDDKPSVPQEFMFAADATPIDPDLLAFATKSKIGKSGGRGLIYSEERGRYIKPMIPRGKVKRLAVDATMRAAAPFQRSRKEMALRRDPTSTRKIFVTKDDMRAKRMARKAGSLIIFCVDASGSMALNRMNAAKGAAMSLLTEAYQSRDQIALIPFQGEAADVLLPPTKSIALAKKRLDTMPCGGGSPLAHALQTAIRTGLNAMKAKDVGRAIIVCISDGRANVPLSVSMGETQDPDTPKPTRDELKEEVLAVAKSLRALPAISLVVLDTENKFVSTGMAKEIAAAAGGRYHYIPKATDKAIAGVASDAIKSINEKK